MSLIRRILVGLCTAVALEGFARGQALSLVADVNAVPTGAAIAERGVAVLGGDRYFVRDDPAAGAELHRLAPGGTPTLVRDIAAGPTGSMPELLTVVGGVLVFVADDGIHGRELRVSDGTGVGTMMVLDLRPGSGGGLYPSPYDRRPLVVVGNRAFFAADDGVRGRELWTSDGRCPSVPRLVRDLATGAAGSSPRHLVCRRESIVFSATDSMAGREPELSSRG